MFITSDKIPNSLWDAAPAAVIAAHPKALRLPRMLIEVYGEMLDELNLWSKAGLESQHIVNRYFTTKVIVDCYTKLYRRLLDVNCRTDAV